MAYRRTERVQQRLNARHAALIAAARALAAESGMEAVQVAPVAARAGIAAGTVYRYFPSKAALVEAVVADLRESELAAIREACAAAPGPLSALAAAIMTFATRSLRQRRLAWAVLGEAVDPELESIRVEYRKALTGEIEQRMRLALAEGRLPPQDAAVSAPALLGAIAEALLRPPSADESMSAPNGRALAQDVALLALRAIGVPDARARGLVIQTATPPDLAPAPADAGQGGDGVSAT